MAKTKLTQEEKMLVAKQFLAGATQSFLSKMWGVSRRTIQRYLIEMQVLPAEGSGLDFYRRRGVETVSDADKEILELVHKHGISSKDLLKSLNQPALTKNNIITLLASASTQSLIDVLQEVKRLRKSKAEVYERT